MPNPITAIAPILERATLDQRRESATALNAKPRTLKRVLRMAERALDRAEAIIEAVSEAVPPPAPIACGPKCPYCCHIRLTASAPEVLLMLEHIRATWDEDAIAALKVKVRNIDAFTRGKDDDARAQQRLPCPLLKDGSCSVHTVRPLSCRAVASVAVAACKAAYASRMTEGVQMFEPQYLAANAVGYGLYAGLKDAGFEIENIELVAALAIGLNDADAPKRWIKGEDVFKNAR